MKGLVSYQPAATCYLPPTEEGLVEEIFDLRDKTLLRKVRLLQGQIAQRKRTLEENLQEIEKDLCLCSCAAFQFPEDDFLSRQYILLNHKFPLYKERRILKSKFLEDVASLQREQIEATLERISLLDKKRIIQ